MSRKIVVLEDAAADIDVAFDFYEKFEKGLGSYFRNCLKNDLISLGTYPGTHRIRFGFYQTRCSKWKIEKSARCWINGWILFGLGRR
jgi:hypothetical protein